MESSSNIRPWRYLWQLVKFKPWLYLGLLIFETLFFGVFPQIVGLIMRSIFDSLTGAGNIGLNVYTLISLLVAAALGKSIAIFIDVWIYFNFRWSIAALLRNNMFTQILKRPGGKAFPDSPGEAVSRFRGDVDEVAFYMAESLILVGFGFFALVAIFVMLKINAQITLIVLIPIMVVIIATNLATKAIQKYREADRKAAGRVTGFIGELFGASQAVQVATAEDRVITQFQEINLQRKKAAVNDRLFGEILHSIFNNAGNLGTGIVLVLVGQQISNGSFSIGDFALFTYYLAYTSDFAGLVGEHLAWIKQVAVSLSRLFRLLQDVPAMTLVEHNPVYLHKELPEVTYIKKDSTHLLRSLECRNLSFLYEGTDKGIRGINLSIKKGTFTVITGRIGSGKSTLLRVLLGLLPLQEGEIFWNGEYVENPATFMVPPRTAYTPQVPSLFSETLKDNILLGFPVDELTIKNAIFQAVLDQDINEFEYGLDTILGSKGIKLSGGQRQRTAAARMFIRQPELSIFDDISSALDIETERTFWERVFNDQSATCLAVSHRKPALRRADHIIVLKDGLIVGEGKLSALLESCSEMQMLWQNESVTHHEKNES